MTRQTGNASAPESTAPPKAESPGRQTPIKILLADDCPLLRTGIRAVVERDQSLVLCAATGNPSETLDTIARLKPDVVLIAFPLRNVSTFTLIVDVCAHHENTPVLVLSLNDDSLLAQRVSRLGVKGIIARTDTAQCVIEAIRLLARGMTYGITRETQLAVGSKSHNPRQSDRAQAPAFTNRQQQVLESIGAGLTPREIARLSG